jgi:hypothetical protein
MTSTPLRPHLPPGPGCDLRPRMRAGLRRRLRRVPRRRLRPVLHPELRPPPGLRGKELEPAKGRGQGLAGEMGIAGVGADLAQRRAPRLPHSPPLPLGSVLAACRTLVPLQHRRTNQPILRHGLQAADNFRKVARQRFIPTGPAR